MHTYDECIDFIHDNTNIEQIVSLLEKHLTSLKNAVRVREHRARPEEVESANESVTRYYEFDTLDALDHYIYKDLAMVSVLLEIMYYIGDEESDELITDFSTRIVNEWADGIDRVNEEDD